MAPSVGAISQFEVPAIGHAAEIDLGDGHALHAPPLYGWEPLV